MKCIKCAINIFSTMKRKCSLKTTLFLIKGNGTVHKSTASQFYVYYENLISSLDNCKNRFS